MYVWWIEYTVYVAHMLPILNLQSINQHCIPGLAGPALPHNNWRWVSLVAKRTPDRFFAKLP